MPAISLLDARRIPAFKYAGVLSFYWRTKEPEDGIYTTVNTQTFDQFDYNTTRFLSAPPKQYLLEQPGITTVLDRHGKLQVRFLQP